ncbi:MAG: hypothetical protein R3C16_01950 [Hyphomonadaceae bacterium]
MELDDGETALRPIEPSARGGAADLERISRCCIAAAPRAALDAWADARLLIVKLDAAAAPVGLRDLDMLDARDELAGGALAASADGHSRTPPGNASGRAQRRMRRLGRQR